MGDIRTLPMKRWREEYGLNTFVETGVDGGAAMLAALNTGYSHAISIEIMPNQVTRASAYLEAHAPSDRWEIRLGDSAEELPKLLDEDPFRDEKTRVLWWLDAHFPERYVKGADAIPTKPVETIDVGTRLPLLDEVRALACKRSYVSRDVIVIDDWRVYDDRAGVAAGPLPHFLRSADGGLPEPTHGDKILDYLAPTHTVSLDPRDGGYLICLPRNA
jgi:hypothetical protein